MLLLVGPGVSISREESERDSLLPAEESWTSVRHPGQSRSGKELFPPRASVSTSVKWGWEEFPSSSETL